MVFGIFFALHRSLRIQRLTRLQSMYQPLSGLFNLRSNLPLLLVDRHGSLSISAAIFPVDFYDVFRMESGGNGRKAAERKIRG